jgi:hypothetical protein
MRYLSGMEGAPGDAIEWVTAAVAVGFVLIVNVGRWLWR